MARRPLRLTLAIVSTTFIVMVSAESSVHSNGLVRQTGTQQPSPEDVAGRAALEQVCGTCHEGTLGQDVFRTPPEWNDVLSRMADKGATGTKEQFTSIKTFLLRNFGKVNVNTAPAHELAPVLEVTPEVAAAVVEQRRANGSFKTIEDLAKVPGIDAAHLDRRKDRLLF